MQAEEGAQNGKQRNIYKRTKLVCGKYSEKNDVLTREKQGQLLTSEKNPEFFNRPTPEEEAEIPEAEEDFNIENGPPKPKDSKSLENHNVLVKDHLNAELFRHHMEQKDNP